MLFNTLLYLAAGAMLVISFRKDRQKTRMALKKGWKSFETILPMFLLVLLLTGMALAWLDQATIARLVGAESGWWGLAITGVIGSITLIPAFAAYPMAGELLRAGAGHAPITMFITTLMIVGLVTLPLEKQFLGKTAYLRNGLGLLYSLVLALIMGWIFA